MKKKIEVTIRNEKGELTFYQQQITEDGKINIPLKQILQQTKKGVKSDKLSVH